jgi:hypothetical protein
MVEARRIWHFDPSGLQPGDIILENGQGLGAAAIRFFDIGNYSHALLWLGGTSFLEAMPGGARVISHARVLIEEPERWLVLRLADSEAAARAASLARKLAAKPYDGEGAASTILPLRRNPDRTKLFCSQLVAEAYARAGVEIVDRQLLPHEITPAALEYSSLLTRIPSPLRELSPERAVAAVPALDRGRFYRDTPMEREMVAAQTAFAAVKVQADKLPPPNKPGVQFPAGNLSDLLDLLSMTEGEEGDALADSLLAQLEKQKYFDLFKDALIPMMMYVNQTYAAHEAGDLKQHDRREFQEWFEPVILGLTPALGRFRVNFQACQAEYARSNRKLWLRLAAMYFLICDGISLLIDRGSQIASA